MRPSRDETGIALARVWAQRATCARRQVGCVLFDADGYQLAAGYNGPASGIPHCTFIPCPGVTFASGRGLDKCEAIHAEQNALLRCADPRRVYACYVTTAPCLHCVKMLLNTACRRIVFAEDYPHAKDSMRLWLHQRDGREWTQVN